MKRQFDLRRSIFAIRSASYPEGKQDEEVWKKEESKSTKKNEKSSSGGWGPAQTVQTRRFPFLALNAVEDLTLSDLQIIHDE